MTDFQGLFDRLVSAGVEFIVVGGVAATAHGSSRTTLDLDVVYARSPENFRRLVTALSTINPYPRGAPPGLPFRWDEPTIRAGLNFTLVTTLGDLDLLGEITCGGGYDALKPHTVTLRILGHDVLCLDLPTLIRVKRAAGRPKDFENVAILERLWEVQQS